MTRNELTDMILDTKRALTFYEGIVTSCKHCVKRHPATDFCPVHQSTVPPDYRDAANECAEWYYDDVPF